MGKKKKVTKKKANRTHKSEKLQKTKAKDTPAKSKPEPKSTPFDDDNEIDFRSNTDTFDYSNGYSKLEDVKIARQ